MVPSYKKFPASVFVFTAYGSRAATQFVILLMIARLDGAVVAGQFATCLAISAPVFALCELGLRNFYQTTTLRLALRQMLAARLLGGATAASTALLIVWGIRPSLLGLMIPIVVLKACDGLIDVVDAGQLTQGRYVLSAKAATGNALLTAAALVVAMAIGWTGAALIWLSTLASVVVLAGLLLHPVRTVNQNASTARARDVVRLGFRLGTAQFATSLSTYLPVLFLSVVVYDEAGAGIYAAAQYWITLTNMIYLAHQQASWRGLRVSLGHGEKRFRARYRPILRRFLILSPICGLLVGIGTFLINPLIYGFEFSVDSTTALVFAATAAVLGYEYAQLTKVLSRNLYALPAAATWAGLVAAVIYLASLSDAGAGVTSAAAAVLLAVAVRVGILMFGSRKMRQVL